MNQILKLDKTRPGLLADAAATKGLPITFEKGSKGREGDVGYAMVKKDWCGFDGQLMPGNFTCRVEVWGPRVAGWVLLREGVVPGKKLELGVPRDHRIQVEGLSKTVSKRDVNIGAQTSKFAMLWQTIFEIHATSKDSFPETVRLRETYINLITHKRQEVIKELVKCMLSLLFGLSQPS
jgi:hypothetical protein